MYTVFVIESMFFLYCEPLHVCKQCRLIALTIFYVEKGALQTNSAGQGTKGKALHKYSSITTFTMGHLRDMVYLFLIKLN